MVKYASIYMLVSTSKKSTCVHVYHDIYLYMYTKDGGEVSLEGARVVWLQPQRQLLNCATVVELTITAPSVEDETRNAESNDNRNPECWGDFSQLQIQIQQKSYSEFVPRDTSEFKSSQNLNSALYREIPRYLIFSILTS